ncbi:unnamed protein product [Scytosiphon promiscuus]
MILNRLKEEAEDRKRSGRYVPPQGQAAAAARAQFDDAGWGAGEDGNQEAVITVPRLRDHRSEGDGHWPPLGQRRLKRRLECAKKHAASAQNPGGAGMRLTTLLRLEAQADAPAAPGAACSGWLDAKFARMRKAEEEEWAEWQRRVAEEEDANPAEAAGPPLPFGFIPRLAHRALGAYALVRTFSRPFRLTPASSVAFLRGLSLRLRTPLLDAIHCELLRRVSCLLRGRTGSWAKGSSAQRELDWQYLDHVTWPAYFVEFVHTMEEQRRREGVKSETEAAGEADAEIDGAVSASEEEEDGLSSSGGDSDTLCSAFQAGEHHLLPLEMKVQALEYLVDRAMECPWFEKEIDHRVRSPPESFVVDADDGKVFDCVICGQVGNLLCCDNCPRAFHPKCVGGRQGINSTNWSCWECLIEDSAKDGVRVPRVRTPMGPVWVIGGYVFRAAPPPSSKRNGGGKKRSGWRELEATACSLFAPLEAAELCTGHGCSVGSWFRSGCSSEKRDEVSPSTEAPASKPSSEAPRSASPGEARGSGEDDGSDDEAPPRRRGRFTRSRLKTTGGERQAPAAQRGLGERGVRRREKRLVGEETGAQEEGSGAGVAIARAAKSSKAAETAKEQERPEPVDTSKAKSQAKGLKTTGKVSKAAEPEKTKGGTKEAGDGATKAGAEGSSGGGKPKEPEELSAEQAEELAARLEAEERKAELARSMASGGGICLVLRRGSEEGESPHGDVSVGSVYQHRRVLFPSLNPLEYVNRYAKAVPYPGMPVHKEARAPLEPSSESHLWHAWPLGAVDVPHPLLPGDPAASPAEGEALVAHAHLEPVARLLIQLQKSFGGLLFGTQWSKAWGVGGEWPEEVRAATSVPALARLAQELLEALPPRVFRESWQTPYELKLSSPRGNRRRRGAPMLGSRTGWCSTPRRCRRLLPTGVSPAARSRRTARGPRSLLPRAREAGTPAKQRRRSTRPAEMAAPPSSISPFRSSRGKRKASLGGGREATMRMTAGCPGTAG